MRDKVGIALLVPSGTTQTSSPGFADGMRDFSSSAQLDLTLAIVFDIWGERKRGADPVTTGWKISRWSATGSCAGGLGGRTSTRVFERIAVVFGGRPDTSVVISYKDSKGIFGARYTYQLNFSSPAFGTFEEETSPRPADANAVGRMQQQ